MESCHRKKYLVLGQTVLIACAIIGEICRPKIEKTILYIGKPSKCGVYAFIEFFLT